MDDERAELRARAIWAQAEMDASWARYQKACEVRKEAFRALQSTTGHGKAGYGDVSAFCRAIGLTRTAFYKVIAGDKPGTGT